MKELFTSLFGEPHGVVVFQLLGATQFTIYLSLIAFIGGGHRGPLTLLGSLLAPVIPAPLRLKLFA